MGERLPGRPDGVQGVALGPGVPRRPLGSADLHHPLTMRQPERGQASTVAAGTLHRPAAPTRNLRPGELEQATITGRIRAEPRIPDGYRRPGFRPPLNKEQEDGGLKDVHANDFFDEVAFSDHAVKADCEQHRRHQVIVIAEKVHGLGFASDQMIKQDNEGPPHHQADSRLYDENAVVA